MTSRQQAWQERQLRAGNCRRCGQKRDGASRILCADCLEKEYRRWRERKTEREREIDPRAFGIAEEKP